MFRRKLAVADEAQKNWRIWRNQSGEQVLFLDARGCAHGASDGGPDGLVRRRRPKKPRTRLVVEAGIHVMSKLSPNRQGEPISNERDFILEESVEDVVCLVIR